jgi:hypothetical protein
MESFQRFRYGIVPEIQAKVSVRFSKGECVPLLLVVG